MSIIGEEEEFRIGELRLGSFNRRNGDRLIQTSMNEKDRCGDALEWDFGKSADLEEIISKSQLAWRDRGKRESQRVEKGELIGIVENESGPRLAGLSTADRGNGKSGPQGSGGVVFRKAGVEPGSDIPRQGLAHGLREWHSRRDGGIQSAHGSADENEGVRALREAAGKL